MMDQSIPLTQNPEMYMDNSTTSESAIVRKADRFSNKRTLFDQCRNILKKPHQTRFPAQNHTLLRLVQRCEFLKELSENVSLDFVKGLLRNAKIEIVSQRQVIVEQEQALNFIVVVLEGKLGVQNSNGTGAGKETIENGGLHNSEMIERLTILAKKERDLLRRTSKLQRKSTFPVSEYVFIPPMLSLNEFQQASTDLERIVLVNQEVGGRQRLTSKTYRHRVFALERSTILVFEMNFVFFWLEVAFKAKLARNIELMRKVPAFEHVEEEKLSEIILSMKQCRKRRGELIYGQGDPSQLLYLLVEGQIKLIKEATLFKENPNDFYVDRRRLIRQMRKNERMSGSKSMQKDDDVLRFANLTTLYNYRPVTKAIEIGVISSFGLFGEQEIIYKTSRETSAIVNCLDAVYYQIDFSRVLEIIGSKNIDKFKEAMEHSISRKVLYRQSEFADHIRFQNNLNLDYFYIDGTTQKQSPRKYKLQKINEKIAPKSARDDISHAPAYFTTFNFNKMINGKQRYSEPKRQNKKTTNQSSSQSIMSGVFNETEEKLVGISHSWNPIQKKVKQEKLLSKKISPFKHQINIKAPLIDQQFFKEVAKEQRRINKEFRTVRLSLGRKSK